MRGLADTREMLGGRRVRGSASLQLALSHRSRRIAHSILQLLSALSGPTLLACCWLHPAPAPAHLSVPFGAASAVSRVSPPLLPKLSQYQRLGKKLTAERSVAVQPGERPVQVVLHKVESQAVRVGPDGCRAWAGIRICLLLGGAH